MSPSPSATNGGAASRVLSVLPGLGVATALAVFGTFVAWVEPVLAAPICAVVVGVAIGQFLSPAGRARLAPGLDFASHRILQISIVVLGTQLSVHEVATIGASSIPVMLATLVACGVMAFFVARALRIDEELGTLIGVGTAICGASAIAAVSSIIRPKSSNVSYAVSTIFFFNILAVLVFPPLGHLLHLTQQEFGLFAGTAVNDTSSVVAAANSYGAVASNHAIVVKLTRTLMIIPVCLVLALIMARRGNPLEQKPGLVARTTRMVPWFLIGFLICAAATSIGLVPASSKGALAQVATFAIAIALGAIGCSTDLRALAKTGLRPMLLGLILSLTVAATSLFVQLVL